MEKEQEIIRTSLRLPKSLYEKLNEAAVGKTMHAEILDRLEASFTHDAQIARLTSFAAGQKDGLLDAVGFLSKVIMDLGNNHPDIPKILADGIRNLKDTKDDK